MNEVWYTMLKNWIESYEAIKTLNRNGIIDEEKSNELKITLLEEDIIETFKSEVED